MKLYANCTACGTPIKLNTTYLTRPDLIAERGEYFNLNCQECGNTKEYHANDVEAKDSFSGSIIGTIIGILIMALTTLFIWNEGFITNLGLILGSGLILASNASKLTSNTNAFNSYKITRNPPQK